MDEPNGTDERQALNEPEPPRGEAPLAIVYDGQQAIVTEPSGQVVHWDVPLRILTDYALAFGLVSLPTSQVAAWGRRSP